MVDDEDDDKDAEDENGNAKKEGDSGKKTKLILMILIGLLLIGISVGGTIAALSMFGEEKAPMVAAGEEGEGGESGEDGAGEGEDSEEEILEDAIYYPIKPSIMVSFEGRGRQRLLQADITLLTRDDDVVAAIELHMPMIRNALVLLIGGRTYEEVQTAEGKELLRVDCLQELQRLLKKEIGKTGIEQVLFTGLIVQ